MTGFSLRNSFQRVGDKSWTDINTM